MKKLIVFFGLVFLITWSIEIPAALYQDHLTSLNPPKWLQNVGTWAPGIVAIVLSVIYGGKQHLRNLLKPLIQFQHPLKWYLYALFFGSIISLISFYAYKTFSGIAIPLDPVYNLFIIILIVVPFSPLWEEIGWRGYALPLLQNICKPLATSLILGFLWGLWHLPMYAALTAYGDKRMIFFLIVFVGCLPLSIIQSWIYNNTRQSLLLCVLFHAGVDASVGYFFQNLPNNQLQPLEIVTGLFICFAIVLVIMTKGRLGYSDQKQPG
jgi:membrane protease YdiL (CAAX protease family)